MTRVFFFWFPIESHAWMGIFHKCANTFPNATICARFVHATDTHRHFGAVRQGVVELHAEGEVDVFGAEGAGFLDVELVARLLDDHLEVVVLGQLPLHHVDACGETKTLGVTHCCPSHSGSGYNRCHLAIEGP